jgi:hypothetical protein
MDKLLSGREKIGWRFHRIIKLKRKKGGNTALFDYNSLVTIL